MRISFDSTGFGYKSILKKEFLEGNIKLKRDITGRPINKDNVTLDHTVPKARGGKSALENYSLMDIAINAKRGTQPLTDFIDLKSLIDYIIVMLDVDLENLNGVEYVKKWLRNLRREV